MSESRLELLRQMAAEEPEDPFGAYALGLELFKLKRFEEGLAILRALQQRHPSYVPVYYQLGRSLWQQDQPEQALHIIDLGISQARDHGDRLALTELGELRELIG